MSKQIPKVEESNKFNFFTSIWIVPFIALIIAGWLAYQYFSQRGPEIEIIFPKNEGLVAGQSVVKFKNVPIGKVTKIYLKEGVDGVVVAVRMHSKTSIPFMTEYAKFWIVKPEVGISGISGLDTLLSGTYIDVYSKKGGTYKEEHIGLVHPYRDSSGGSYFMLHTIDEKSMLVGTPVYYKDIKVGQVEYINLGLDGVSLDIIIFVKNEYVSFIHNSSKFWTRSLVNVDYSKGTLDVNVAPMNYLLQGGIIFSSYGEDKEDVVAHKYSFPLYNNKAEAMRTRISMNESNVKKFILETNESMARLKTHAVVRYEEFDIGQVEEVSYAYNKKTHKIVSHIVIGIDTTFFKDSHYPELSGEVNLYQAVKDGLRAKVDTLDPLSRMLFIDLTFMHKDGNASIVKKGDNTLFPMASYEEEGLMASMSQILAKVNALPLKELVVSLNGVIKNADTLMLDTDKMVKDAGAVVKGVDKPLVTALTELKTTINNLNKMTNKKTFSAMPDEFTKTLKELTQTLKTTKKVVKGYDGNSLIVKQLSQTLNTLSQTSEEMQLFLKMLNRKPNSLIFGDK